MPQRLAISAEQARQDAYERLMRTFRPIAEQLDENGRTDLDGILWVLAAEVMYAPSARYKVSASPDGDA